VISFRRPSRGGTGGATRAACRACACPTPGVHVPDAGRRSLSVNVCQAYGASSSRPSVLEARRSLAANDGRRYATWDRWRGRFASQVFAVGEGGTSVRSVAGASPRRSSLSVKAARRGRASWRERGERTARARRSVAGEGAPGEARTRPDTPHGPRPMSRPRYHRIPPASRPARRPLGATSATTDPTARSLDRP
jgi:hypothetical protein